MYFFFFSDVVVVVVFIFTFWTVLFVLCRNQTQLVNFWKPLYLFYSLTHKKKFDSRVIFFVLLTSFVIRTPYKKVQSLTIWRYTFADGKQTHTHTPTEKRIWRKIGETKKLSFKSVETKRIFIARATYWILSW